MWWEERNNAFPPPKEFRVFICGICEYVSLPILGLQMDLKLLIADLEIDDFGLSSVSIVVLKEGGREGEREIGLRKNRGMWKCWF